MQSRHFKTLLVALLLCVILYFTYVLLQEKDEIKRVVSKSQTKKILKENNSRKELTTKRLGKLKRPIKAVDIVSDYFSPDPFFNQLIIYSEYSDCLEYFTHLKDHNHEHESLESKNNNKNQSKRIRMKECDLAKLEHPEFNLSDDTLSFYEKLYQYPSQSFLEKVLRNEINIYEGNVENSKKFIRELSQADPRILRTAEVDFKISDYHMYHSSAIILDLVQSQQIGYVMYLSHYAQMIYTCNMSKTCTRFNYPLKSVCRGDDRFCGINDYNEYIKIAFSPGHQADIKIVLNYIEELFNPQTHEQK